MATEWETVEAGTADAELARDLGADVVVGFSMGAMVAYAMAVSGAFAGPVVLLGSSFSTQDEPAFFHAVVRLTSVLGTLPVAVLKKGAASMVKKAAVSPERRAELKSDFERNDAGDLKKALRAYADWLGRDDDRGSRLCDGPPDLGRARREGRGRPDFPRAVDPRGVPKRQGRDDRWAGHFPPQRRPGRDCGRDRRGGR